MATKHTIAVEGKIYFTIPEAARLLGTTTTKLKRIAVQEGLDFQNFRPNGKLYISEENVNAYRERNDQTAVIPRVQK